MLCKVSSLKREVQKKKTPKNARVCNHFLLFVALHAFSRKAVFSENGTEFIAGFVQTSRSGFTAAFSHFGLC